MEDKHATIKDDVIPDLLVSPHIVNELFNIVIGEWQPDSTQQEQMVEHLRGCEYCRKALLVLLSADSGVRDVAQLYRNSSTQLAHTI